MVLDFVVFLTQSDVLKLRDILPDTILCLADDSEDIQGSQGKDTGSILFV